MCIEYVSGLTWIKSTDPESVKGFFVALELCRASFHRLFPQSATLGVKFIKRCQCLFKCLLKLLQYSKITGICQLSNKSHSLRLPARSVLACDALRAMSQLFLSKLVLGVIS